MGCPYLANRAILDRKKEDFVVKEYRKKPVVVEAVQWHKDGDHPKVRPLKDNREDDINLIGMAGELVLPLGREKYGFIETSKGGILVSQGDWIIKGSTGEFYLCKPDVFEKTYEEAI
jgi:hypothetical protein